MKWLILIVYLTSSGTEYADSIPLSDEVTTESQCMTYSMPVLAMWANAQPGDIQIVKFTCIEDDGRGGA